MKNRNERTRYRFAMWAFVVAAFVSPAFAADKPNLLILHTDEHNFRTLGCYRATLPAEQALMWGPAVVETPNIDWLAAHGALCTRFYATTPVCSPSRAALVSGRYPQNTAIVTNDIPMDGQVVTFAEILRRQGYATGYAGKWHLDGPGRPQWQPERKFGFDDNRYMFNRGHWKQLEDTAAGPRVKATDAKGQPSYNVRGADETSFTTDFLANKTIDFLRAHRDGPFCYMVSFPDPHGPDAVRPPYDTMFAGRKYEIPKTFNVPSDVPSWGRPSEPFNDMALYYGMVKCIDDNIGRILDALRANGQIDNTIVVFTSDHGDLRGEHHRQNKGVPFEASAKIPFVLYYPGRVKPGTIVRKTLGCVDFLPTVLGLMGVPTAGKEQGRNASDLFTTGKTPEGWTDVSFLRGTGGPQGWLAAVAGRYKLVLASSDDPWLFDLEKDPDELVNFFRDPACRETVRELSRQLLDYGTKYGDPRLSDAKIKADLAWAIEGTGPYVSTVPSRPARETAPAGKKAGKGRKAGQARRGKGE